MIETILVAVDLEDPALTDRMLAVTSDFAKLKGAQVTLVHVESDIPPAAAIQLPDDYRDQTSSAVSNQLGDLVGTLDLPAGAAKAAVRVGSIYREILAQAEADKSDLIVIGCHQPDLADFLLGPNAARVVRHATCSVFVVR
ncbi:universal stress protein [Pelagibius sp.]|uniref:universal stress protein n=1 Tax=Pelagibius sp. TaxID=1931238 RepID=UPI00261E1A25|nr:universal stress protein [Pelagibius sp.]